MPALSSRTELLLGYADDELIVGWRDSEWTGIAPTLEEDVAFSSIAQNEIGRLRPQRIWIGQAYGRHDRHRREDNSARCSPRKRARLFHQDSPIDGGRLASKDGRIQGSSPDSRSTGATCGEARYFNNASACAALSDLC